MIVKVELELEVEASDVDDAEDYLVDLLESESAIHEYRFGAFSVV